jgi:glutamate N-acetyltransferase/amino-acid N-acetyltransferase
MTVTVEGGKDEEAECLQSSYLHSYWLKPFFLLQTNLGRILAAIGYTGVENLDVSALKLFGTRVLVAGGRASAYVKNRSAAIMQEPGEF